MAVEIYFCQNCDYETEYLNLWTGCACPKCYSHLSLGDPALKGDSLKKKDLYRPQRRRRAKGSTSLDPEAKDLYLKFQRELLDLRESEEIHYMQRRKKLYEEDVIRKESFKRKAEAAPVVFHAFRKNMTEELDENERLFSGVEVSTLDYLETPDYQEDSTHLERDLFDDIPFGELIAPSMW